MHAHNLVHRDLKPANIVVDPRGVLRLIDFGQAAFAYLPGHPLRQRFDGGYEDLVEKNGFSCGTLPYKAIEVLLGDTSCGQPMDIWSIGCVVFELIVCAPLFGSPCLPEDMVKQCFAQLGQQHRVGCLSGLIKWRPFLNIRGSHVNFTTRIRHVAPGPGGEACGRFAEALLNFDKRERPNIAGCLALWTAYCRQLKLSGLPKVRCFASGIAK